MKSVIWRLPPNHIRYNALPANIRKLVFYEIKRDGITPLHGIHDQILLTNAWQIVQLQLMMVVLFTFAYHGIITAGYLILSSAVNLKYSNTNMKEIISTKN